MATGVARLGAGALFVSAIGRDDLGDDFLALLQGESRSSTLSTPRPRDMPEQGAAEPAWLPCGAPTTPSRGGPGIHAVPAARGPRIRAERGVDTGAVQRVDRPTRDILVVRSPDGDREFAGFGKVRAPAGAHPLLPDVSSSWQGEDIDA